MYYTVMICRCNFVLTNQDPEWEPFCVLERRDKNVFEKTERTFWHQTRSQSQINYWSNYLMICQQYPRFHSASNCLTGRSVGWLTALTSVRKKPHFHTRHIKEQNKHDTIESDLLNLSHPHRWPLLWLMRSVAHECLWFCSAWLMVTFGCLVALSKAVPHTQWPAAGALTMARPTVDTHTSSCGWPSWPLLWLPWN